MVRQVNVTVQIHAPQGKANQKLDVFECQLITDDDKGFTTEQLSLLLADQMRLTLQGIESVEGVQQTDLEDYVP